jgi:HEAT repeat protein
VKTRSLAIVAGTAADAALLWLCARPARVAHSPSKPGAPNGRPLGQQGSAGGSPANAREAGPGPEAVPEAVRPTIGLGHESAAARWAAIRALGTHLDRAEIEALCRYLRGHEIDADGPMRGVLKNDVILALKNQQPPPEQLAGVLLGMFRDKEQDPVIRNYALQHLATWYEQCGQKAQVLAALWAGTTDPDASIAGTALIGLGRLSQDQAGPGPASSQPVPAVDPARLATAASALAQDPNGSEAARVTALQVCAQLGMKEVLPAAVDLAQSAASVPLRMSALAAVGALGGPDQVPLLFGLLTADDPRIQTAARAALRRLEARLNG